MRSLGPRVAPLDLRTARPPAKRADAFYLSQEWRSFVEMLIVERFGDKRNARCQDPQCEQRQRRGIRLFGDHVKERKDGGALFNKSNVLFRCGACHTRKTNEHRARRMGVMLAG